MTNANQPTTKIEPVYPSWYVALKRNMQTAQAHAFILYGAGVKDKHHFIDVDSYQNPQSKFVTIVNLIKSRLLASHDIILTISVSEGMTFATDKMKERFIKLLKLDANQPQATNSFAQKAAQGKSNEIQLPNRFAEIAPLIDQLLKQPHRINKSTGDLASGPLTEELVAGKWEAIKVCVLIENGQFILPDAGISETVSRPGAAESLERVVSWAGTEIGDRGHLLVLLSEVRSDINNFLLRTSSRWKELAVDLPDTADRLANITTLFNEINTPENPITLVDGLTLDEAARRTAGLRLIEIEDIILAACYGDGALSRQLIKALKDEFVSQEFGDVMRIEHPLFGLERVGGYQYIKDWLFANMINPLREGRRVPGGMLLTGPAGTGKSQLAEALAGELKIPYVKFDPSRIFGKYVGDTESNLERLLQTVMGMNGCILFMDELDKLFSFDSANAGNAVEGRVLARIQNFMEDPRRFKQNVIIIAATNYPERIPPAMRERFPVAAPVLPPTDADRPAVVAALSKYLFDGQEIVLDVNSQESAAMRGWVGRTIRGVLEKALAIYQRGSASTPEEALRSALLVFRATTRDVEAMTRRALAELSDLELVPQEYHEMVFGIQKAQAEEDRGFDDYDQGPRRGRNSGL